MELYLAVLFMAGLVAMDTTSGPQMLVSEPLVSCTLFGLLFGRPELGVMTGVLFQMLSIGYMPLGGEHFTDNNMAACISCASLLAAQRMFGLSGAEESAALTVMLVYGVAVGVVGLHLKNYERRLNGIRAGNIMRRLKHGDPVTVGSVHRAGISASFVKGALMAAVLVPAGTVLCRLILFLPLPLVNGMSTASHLVWGSVAASGVVFYLAKGRSVVILLGSLGGIAWIVFTKL